MHRNRRRRQDLAGQVLPNVFGHERDNRCHDLGCGVQGIEQYPIRQLLVAFIAGLPEAAAVCADIPIGNIVDKHFKIFNQQIGFVVVIIFCRFL